jgi:flagellar basal-body rod modification protein FlgD
MASAISAIAGSAAATGAASSTAALSNGGAPTKELFLQLLVAQIKNQDPLNPSDGLQFVSQLAQFSELEQVMAIRGDIETASTTSNGGSTTAAT